MSNESKGQGDPFSASQSPPDWLLIAVGNSRTRASLIEGDALDQIGDGRMEIRPSQTVSFANEDHGEVARRALDLSEGRAACILASVNPPFSESLEAALEREFGATPLLIGRDVPIQIDHSLTDASTVGQDRLLNAIAAFAKSEQACVVIDAGTAITVDFVDGVGTFHGGTIAPGVGMMLDALHDHTASLPRVESGPDVGDTPFGRNTPDAILKGVRAAAIGMVHHLIEKYAMYYEAYPQIIATGGDAATLFKDDELIEAIVPDLQTMGMALAVHRWVSHTEDE